MRAIHLLAPLVGRMLLCALFVLSGIGKLMAAEATKGAMASEGLPLIPLLYLGAVVVEIGGGACVLLGFQTRWASLALFLFLIPVTLTFHDFWTASDEQAQEQTIHFLKNLAIMGGLLVLLAHGPGPLSVDAARRLREMD